MREYEQHKEGPSRGGGWVVLLICACMLAWGLFQYVSIHDSPRQWDFGTLPDLPGESIYSTSRPAQAISGVPQAGPLPEARPQPSTASAPGGAGGRP